MKKEARKILFVLASIFICSCQKEAQWQTDAYRIEVRYPSGVSDTYVYWEYYYLAYKTEEDAFWIKCVSLSENLETTRKYIGCTYKVERKTQEDEK